MAGVIRDCEQCGKPFTTIPAKLKVGKGKYCSCDCYYKAKANSSSLDGIRDTIIRLYYDENKSVHQVGAELSILPATLYGWMSRRGMILREQKVSVRRGDKHPCYKGGFYNNSQGYIRHTKSGKLVHRQIAEQVLGRPLGKDETVHHVNGDRSDNRNQNLLICSRAYHTWLHRKMDVLKGKILFGGKKPVPTRHSRRARSVTIKGTHYKSLTAAAESHSVSRSIIKHWATTGIASYNNLQTREGLNAECK